MNSDGSNPVNLTRHPAWDFMPTWSPDGTQLAFLSDRTGPWEIWTMAADGSNQMPLISTETLAGVELTYSGVNERILSWQ